jgi:hypothetical protein
VVVTYSGVQGVPEDAGRRDGGGTSEAHVLATGEGEYLLIDLGGPVMDVAEGPGRVGQGHVGVKDSLPRTGEE